MRRGKSGYGDPLDTMMRARLGRECLYVPSGRFGLYLALRHWCPPGGRVLMSPVNDDVILFVVLAAGLRPVQAPVSGRDGNIDPGAVPDSVWKGLSAVLTTNLYGSPDRVADLRGRCDRWGIPLLEDAAHAIGSTVGGRPVGSFGAASAFSFSKHVAAKAGGIISFEDPGDRSALADLRDELLAPRRLLSEIRYALRPAAETAVRRLRLVGAARRTIGLLGLDERGASIRMPLRARELSRAVAGDLGLEPFHSWVRVDLHEYHRRQGAQQLGRMRRRMSGLETQLERRRRGVELLRASPWAANGALEGDGVQPLFRVPLMVAERDRLITGLDRHQVPTGYLYDPPLDDYAGAEFTDPSPSPEPARRFARHALPVDPLAADRVIRLLTALRAEPAPGEEDPGRTGTQGTSQDQYVI